jgi:hypothetical protein
MSCYLMLFVCFIESNLFLSLVYHILQSTLYISRYFISSFPTKIVTIYLKRMQWMIYNDNVMDVLVIRT